MNTATAQAIIRHGEQLLKLFPDAAERDPVKLCKKLRQLEHKAAAIGLQLCNGPEMSEEELDDREAGVLNRLDAVLEFRAVGVPVFVNKDPRGYALKVDSDWMEKHPEVQLHHDWGGYGIIAPDLTE